MSSILNDHSKLNKFLISNGLRPTGKEPVSAYILEKKLFRYIKEFWKERNAYPEDIELFEGSLKDFNKDTINKIHELLEKETLINVMKKYFKKASHLEVYKRYNI